MTSEQHLSIDVVTIVTYSLFTLLQVVAVECTAPIICVRWTMSRRNATKTYAVWRL